MRSVDLKLTRRQLGAAIVAAASVGTRPPSATTANEANCATISTYPVPEGSHPHDVAPAADGVSIWFTAQRSGHLGRLSPLTGETVMFDLGKNSAPHGVILGPDGAPWITDGGRDEIQRLDPETEEILRFPTGLRKLNLNTATFDLDGRLWFTGQQGDVGVLNPESGEVVHTEAPRGKGPYGICTTPTGVVWYVSLAGGYLGRLRLKEGEIRVSELDPPTADSGTRRVWSDSAGNLWIAQWNTGQVACYSPDDRFWREWKLPGDSPQAYAVYVDETDIVWLTEFGANAIVRFDSERESFDVFPLPHGKAAVRQLAGRPGEIWGAESGADHLVVIRTICAGP